MRAGFIPSIKGAVAWGNLGHDGSKSSGSEGKIHDGDLNSKEVVQELRHMRRILSEKGFHGGRVE